MKWIQFGLQEWLAHICPLRFLTREGQVKFKSVEQFAGLKAQGIIAAQYIDNNGSPTELYPANPNGSSEGITAITNLDGRVAIMMPHPERVFRAVSNSWHPENWTEDGAWMRLFRNARMVF